MGCKSCFIGGGEEARVCCCFCRRRRQKRKNAKAARARTATGTPTAGPITEPRLLEPEDAGGGVVGEAEDGTPLTTLEVDITSVLEPPLVSWTTEVSRTTLVDLEVADVVLLLGVELDSGASVEVID